MESLNLRSLHKPLYGPRAGRPELIDVPPLRFLAVSGAIEKGASPDTSIGFANATSALYGVAYTLKFGFKKRASGAVDYPVMPLEGLWWVEDGVFDIAIKDNWHYDLMILQPEVATEDLVKEAIEKVRRKKGDSEAVDGLRLESWAEGRCVQIMHVGPYATEPESIDLMREFMERNSLVDQVGFGGKHHEIYLGDPRRAQPEKLKTILRHPVV